MWVQTKIEYTDCIKRYKILNEKTGIVVERTTPAHMQGIFNVKDMTVTLESAALRNNCNFRWAISYNDETGVLRLADLDGNITEYTDLKLIERTYALMSIKWHDMLTGFKLKKSDDEWEAYEEVVDYSDAEDTVEQPTKTITIGGQEVLIRKPIPERHAEYLLDMIDKYFGRTKIMGMPALDNLHILNKNIQEYCESNNIWNTLNWDYDVVYEKIYNRIIESYIPIWVIAPLKIVRADRNMHDYYKTLHYPPKVAVSCRYDSDVQLGGRSVELAKSTNFTVGEVVTADYIINIIDMTESNHPPYLSLHDSPLADKMCYFFLLRDESQKGSVIHSVRVVSYALETIFKGSYDEIWADKLVFAGMRCKTLDLSKFRSMSKQAVVEFERDVKVETLILPEQGYSIAPLSKLTNIHNVVNYVSTLNFFFEEVKKRTNYKGAQTYILLKQVFLLYLPTFTQLEFLDLSGLPDVSFVLAHLALCPASRFIVDNSMIDVKLCDKGFFEWLDKEFFECLDGEPSILKYFRRQVKNGIKSLYRLEAITLKDICETCSIVIVPNDSQHSMLMRNNERSEI